MLGYACRRASERIHDDSTERTCRAAAYLNPRLQRTATGGAETGAGQTVPPADAVAAESAGHRAVTCLPELRRKRYARARAGGTGCLTS
jgi:hypothetical protein